MAVKKTSEAVAVPAAQEAIQVRKDRFAALRMAIMERQFEQMLSDKSWFWRLRHRTAIALNRYQFRIAALDRLVGEQMTLAGLDASKTYQLNDEAGTATAKE